MLFLTKGIPRHRIFKCTYLPLGLDPSSKFDVPNLMSEVEETTGIQMDNLGLPRKDSPLSTQRSRNAYTS